MLAESLDAPALTVTRTIALIDGDPMAADDHAQLFARAVYRALYRTPDSIADAGVLGSWTVGSIVDGTFAAATLDALGGSGPMAVTVGADRWDVGPGTISDGTGHPFDAVAENAEQVIFQQMFGQALLGSILISAVSGPHNLSFLTVNGDTFNVDFDADAAWTAHTDRWSWDKTEIAIRVTAALTVPGHGGRVGLSSIENGWSSTLTIWELSRHRVLPLTRDQSRIACYGDGRDSLTQFEDAWPVTLPGLYR